MKYLCILFAVIFLTSCSDEKEKQLPSQNHKTQWPASSVFTGNNNSFVISLSKELNGISFKQTDTLKTIYDNAIQDVYLMENDSISMTISVARYSKNVIQKRKPEKLFESAMNNFLHALDAKSTQSMRCTKAIQNSSTEGVRTFYTFIDGMTRFYGASEMYLFDDRLYHIAILTTSKDAISNSPSIALAFHSFMPQ
jgi:hypothetical protein